MWLRGVAPDLLKALVADRIAADESIHQRLKQRIAELDDDVVDRCGESGSANQREAELVPLFVSVCPSTKRHDIVILECRDDGADRIGRYGGRTGQLGQKGGHRHEREQDRCRVSMSGTSSLSDHM